MTGGVSCEQISHSGSVDWNYATPTPAVEVQSNQSARKGGAPNSGTRAPPILESVSRIAR